MTLSIHSESPLSPDARALLGGSERALRSVYTAEECFTFTAEELDRPAITFLVARKGKVAIGCVALMNAGDYGEVKRLFVSPAARGSGAARALMLDLETRARQANLPEILLETGEKLAAAVALYETLGYQRRGPFGSYEDNPASLFMGKAL